MTTLEKVDSFKRLWRVALPHVAEPQAEDAIRWALYPVDVVESSILQTAKRFAAGKLTSDFLPAQAYRYVTGTARSITQRRAVAASSRDIAPANTELHRRG